MITGKHVREEMEATQKIIDDPKVQGPDKIKAVYKLITVVLKVVLSVRTNTKLIMDKIGAKPLPPRKRDDKSVDDVEE